MQIYERSLEASKLIIAIKYVLNIGTGHQTLRILLLKTLIAVQNAKLDE